MSIRVPDIIGSLIFCPECGNLLDTPSDDKFVIVCELCDYSYDINRLKNIEVVTTSSPNAFRSALRQKRSLVQQKDSELETSATINEKCPNCGHHEMNFHTMQLRSADEGQTIFYNCSKCGHKFSLNS